jgi:hypothetical protein
MIFIRKTTWEEVFDGWRKREASNPDWVRCATEIKGWPDWESWRSFSANQFDAENLPWGLWEIENPMEEIPEMLVGPFTGWQGRFADGKKNVHSFEDLLNDPDQFVEFSNHEVVKYILDSMPFSTELIAVQRGDNGKFVCIDGHHRATAITLARKLGREIDFSKVRITVALAYLSPGRVDSLDEMLKRGSSKEPRR